MALRSCCMVLAIGLFLSAGCSSAGREVDLKLDSVELDEAWGGVTLPVDTDDEVLRVVALYLSDVSPELVAVSRITRIGEGSMIADSEEVPTLRVFIEGEVDSDYRVDGYLEVDAATGYVYGALPPVAE